MASRLAMPPPSSPSVLDDQSTVCGASSAGSPPSATSSRSLMRPWGLLASQTSAPSSPTQADDLAIAPSPVERAVPIDKTPHGWPYLAKEMVTTPEFESFCRFRELNVKSLLYQQVEIEILQQKLRDLEVEDFNGEKPQCRYAESADEMFLNRDKGGAKARQCDLVYEIRGLLKEYNDALLRHAQVSRLPQPEPMDVSIFRGKLRDGSTTLFVTGSGEHTWGKHNEQVESPKGQPLRQRIRSLVKNRFSSEGSSSKKDLDLVTVHQHPELDKFTHWVAHVWTPFWHRLRYSQPVESTSDPRFGTVKKYSERTMLRFTSCVATMVACLLPVAGISILTTAKTTGQKLGYISGFTAIFALMLMCLTDVKSRTSIFTATSAFSAVLVVFVQNQ